MIARPARRVLGPLVATLLVLPAAGCTHDSGARRSGAGATPTATTPASVAMHVQVTHVAGRLGSTGRRSVVGQVRRTLSSYASAAFLSGTYPRTDFDGSFAGFTSGAAARADQDQDLLTNKPLGASTRSVRMVQASAYLSVLAPEQRASGATAAVDWVFAVDRGDETGQRVRLRGRLLLTRDGTGTWKIFGYDLSRSASPAGSGS